MNFFSRLSSRIWIIALICAAGFLFWIDAARVHRVDYISGLAEPAVAIDVTSPTGYASELRRLIVPEHNNESYQWIAQTQQMLARGEGRVRHVDYDNAPVGREVRTPSPYRWWLGLVAWCDHVVSGRSLGQAVEYAALWADPALHLLLLASAVIFTARQLGTVPATLLAFGLAAAFPFAGVFLPGQPGDNGLLQVCAFWSVLLLLAGISAGRKANPHIPDPTRVQKRTRRWFLAAGVAGGIGLWVSVPGELPVIAGIAVGGLSLAWLKRSNVTATEIMPWRIWALSGAMTTLSAYFIEYFPSHMAGLRLETIHPLFGLAWLGVGELLEQTAAWRQRKNPPGTARRVLAVVLAFIGVAAVPAVIKLTNSDGLMPADTFGSRLTNLPDGAVAQNLWAWLVRDGFTATTAATFPPLLFIGPAIWLLLRRTTGAVQREMTALILGPVLIALGLACFHLGWWSPLDCTLLTLLIAITPLDSTSKRSRWLWSGGLALILVPGAMLLVSQIRTEKRETVAESDVIALIERDLAYWLSAQAGPGGAIVLAPPSLTTSLYFHGGLSGLGTPYWENKDGFAAAIRIAGATSPEEAQTVAQRHNLTYIVVPSWDSFMDEYARLGSRQPDRSLIALLHQWLPPRWLRPVPYHLPKISGFEGLSVVVFKVTEVQDNPTALSRLAEYFIEMGQMEQAALVGQALDHLFPDDLGALVARSLVKQAHGDATGFADIIKRFPAYVARGDDNSLPWDRRVSLAIALTEGKRFELAREETKHCLGELDEARIRSLTTLSLYRLQALAKAFGLEIVDPRLRALSRKLLPAEMSERL